MNAAHTAEYPEPFQILGLRLLPLTLTKYRLLARFGIAFVSDTEAKWTLADLLLGLIICSRSSAEFLELLQAGELGPTIKAWRRRICPLPALGLLPGIGRWWRKRYAFNIYDKVILFKQYIEVHTKTPPVWDLKESPPTGSHWSQNLEIILRSQLGWTTKDLDEAPLCKALHDYLKWAENQEAVRFMTAEEVQYVAELEKQERQNSKLQTENSKPKEAV